MTPFKVTTFCLLCLTAFACELSDGKRCAGDLLWDDAVHLCYAPPATDAATSDETDDAGTSSTFGTLCNGDEECSGEVDFCLFNPMAPNDPGMCTLENCKAEDCPDAFECCDCTSLKLPTACVRETDASTLIMFGCTCS